MVLTLVLSIFFCGSIHVSVVLSLVPSIYGFFLFCLWFYVSMFLSVCGSIYTSLSTSMSPSIIIIFSKQCVSFSLPQTLHWKLLGSSRVFQKNPLQTQQAGKLAWAATVSLADPYYPGFQGRVFIQHTRRRPKPRVQTLMAALGVRRASQTHGEKSSPVAFSATGRVCADPKGQLATMLR